MSVARTLRIGEISGGHLAAAERASIPLASSIASTVQSFVDALSAEGRAAEPPAPRAADQVVDAALSALGAMPASTAERTTAVSLDGPSALAALLLYPLPRVDVGPRARAEIPSEDGRDSLADLIAAGMPEEAANEPHEAERDAAAHPEPVTRLPLGSFTPPKAARPSLFSDAGETDAPPPMARAVWPGLTLPRGVARGGKRPAAPEPAVEARIDARPVAMLPAAANASPSTLTTPRGSFGGDGTRRGTAARPALGPEAASVTLRGEPAPVLREPPAVTLRGEPAPVLREPPSEVRLAPAPRVLGPANPAMALEPTLVSAVAPAPSGGVRVQRAIALPAEDDAGPIPLVRPRSVEAAFPLTKKRAFHPTPASAEQAHGPAVLDATLAPAEQALADARSFLRVESAGPSLGPSLPAPAAVPQGSESPEDRWAGRANYLAPAAPSATGASRIELVHPSLGALTLELTTERAHAPLDVDIGAASSGAAIALRGTEEDLRRELREHGGELGRFRVRTRPTEEDASAKGTWQPRQAHERRRI